jgi:hypothetical protein
MASLLLLLCGSFVFLTVKEPIIIKYLDCEKEKKINK